LEFAQSASGHTCANRHAFSARHIYHRLFDLEKNPHARGMELPRSTLDLCLAYRSDVDQRADRLRVFASRNRSISTMATKKRGRFGLVRLVAMAGRVWDFSRLGDWRNFFC